MRPAPTPRLTDFQEETSPTQNRAKIADLVATARRLRKTRAACQKFLALWALQQGHAPCPNVGGHNENKLNDPMNDDWSLLYLGSILDD